MPGSETLERAFTRNREPFRWKAVVACVKHWTGLDRAIAFTVIARMWSAAAGLITILLIAWFLNPAEQGYYYTFSSLVALQIVFELGFSFVVLQLATHERARLSISTDGNIEGDATAHCRIASVLQKSVLWYSVAAAIMIAALVPAGLHFFAVHQRSVQVSEWRFPWCFLVAAAAITFQLNPVFSFLEGCGYVAQVAQVRFGQAVLGSLFAWIALLVHHGLMAPGMLITGQAVFGLGCLIRNRRLLWGLMTHRVADNGIRWRTEIWPFQWRIAISWLCGYFIFQLFNPVLFAYCGPVVAGQMGMSLNIATAVGAVAMSWMNTKASPFGNMIARGSIEQLDSLFFRTLRQSTSFLLVGATALLVCLLFVARHYPRLALRVLAPWAFALLLLTTVSTHIVFSEALYLRAHKREPFLIHAIVNAILVGTSTVVLGRSTGANGVIVAYFLGSGVFGLAFGTYIFVRKRREWHSLTLVAEV